MTIYLPEDIPDFRLAFDGACKRIIETKLDPTFCELLFELITRVSNHSLIKENLLILTTKFKKQKQEFDSLALEAIEDQWKRLWQFHYNLNQRKKLGNYSDPPVCYANKAI